MWKSIQTGSTSRTPVGCWLHCSYRCPCSQKGGIFCFRKTLKHCSYHISLVKHRFQLCVCNCSAWEQADSPTSLACLQGAAVHPKGEAEGLGAIYSCRCTSVRSCSHVGTCNDSARDKVEIYHLGISLLFICSFCTKFLPFDFVGLRQTINSWFCFLLNLYIRRTEEWRTTWS